MLKYIIDIPNPQTHLVNISLDAVLDKKTNEVRFYMPSWSPGSYLMREYARNIKEIKVEDSKGNRLFHEQISKNEWRVDLAHPSFQSASFTEDGKIRIAYTIYCHELTVRTSHVDNTHAFLHGPSVFIGIEGETGSSQVEIKINPLWSKVTTALKDISEKRDHFIYEAADFDELLDTPIEIGCHETYGFMHQEKEHHIAFYGDFAHAQSSHKVMDKLNDDIKTIVEETAKIVGDELPYDHYYFITHLSPSGFGGLEHLDSTVLQFCPYHLAKEKGYKEYMELVAHEYFHLWNVKRIRPVELGPFDYKNENYTRMHWLTEGMTSFIDQLITYRSGFYSLEEYLGCMKKNINNYLGTPGRGYHSLEDSSFNAWIKLYRAGENFKNSSVSYYLKGGLVFFILNTLMKIEGKGINDLVRALWADYKERPAVGLTKEGFFEILEGLVSKKVSDEFRLLVEGVEEIDFEDYLKRMGASVEWTTPKLDIGANIAEEGGKLIVKSIRQDSCGYKGGLNAGDELIAINSLRLDKKAYDSIAEMYKENDQIDFLIARTGKLMTLRVTLGNGLKEIKEIKIEDEKKLESFLK
ncbi:M61 family metallopeptidase [Halobacteriovorax sp. GFR7]|uniref:M61 family metallopeptidase n=1 Tax=unclassified Halobacteriovorax TaxID=2639665 RepID=UPI003D960C39